MREKPGANIEPPVQSASGRGAEAREWLSLHRNGRVFLVANFRAQEKLADSVNHLLLVGFYLINIGFVCLALRYGDKPTDIVGRLSFSAPKSDS
jgi:hypothetical protein